MGDLSGNILSSLMYKDYLDKHISGLSRVYQETLYPAICNDCSPATLDKISRLISEHDNSKKSDEEWAPYRNYFYDPENNSRSSEEFNYAWNHHQKSNPHHWQYWCLINDVDEPQVQALDMPFEYIIEMLCDWQSAGMHYGNTAYDWYQKQKDKMILSENTRRIVEKYIEYLK